MTDPGKLGLSNRVVGSHVVVVVSGTVDRIAAPRFRRYLLAAIDSTDGGIIVDLSEVDLLDSSGLGALLFAYERSAAMSRPFALVFDDELLDEIFRISGFARLYGIFPDVKSAVDAL